MPDYKQMYIQLFNKVSSAVQILQEAQLDCEAMLLAEENNSTLFPGLHLPQEDEETEDSE